MKKVWVFVLGVITGIILTFMFLFIIAISNNNGTRPGLNIFDQPSDCLINKSSLKVFQVLEPGVALTKIKDDRSSAVYLLVNDEGKLYYDDEVIKLPTGKCFKQTGTYQYQTKDERIKTVPVVFID